MTFKYWQRECSTCKTKSSILCWDYELDGEKTLCVCGSQTQGPEGPNQATAVIGDDIPGGLDVRHGPCNPDGTPRRFYTKSDIKKAAEEAGWCHLGDTPHPERSREARQEPPREPKRWV